MSIFDDYKTTVRAAVVSWGASVVLVAGRALEWIPLQYSSLTLLTVGIGIATSVSLGRMRLTGAITQVFQVGFRSAITLSANVFTDTCILVVKDGVIENADHADAIGWEPEKLKGVRLEDILAPRSHKHSRRPILPGTSITSPMLNEDGDRFDARLSIAEVSKAEVDQGRLIVTVSPVVNPEGTYKLT